MPMARQHSTKAAPEQDPVASTPALPVPILSLADLVGSVDKAVSEQNSILKISSVHLAALQEVRDEGDEAAGRFKKRFWLERISRCRRTSPSWMLRRACRKILSLRRSSNVRHVLALA